MEQVKRLLQELLKTEGVVEALVVGRDGFVIEHAGSKDADNIGAAVSTSIGTVEAMARKIGHSELDAVMAEYKDGTVMIAPIGKDAILGISTREGANLGGVRYAVKKSIREFERVL